MVELVWEDLGWAPTDICGKVHSAPQYKRRAFPANSISHRAPSRSPSSLGFRLVSKGRRRKKKKSKEKIGVPCKTGSMAMHAGMGLSKVVLLVGAGFTGSIMMRNGRLSDILTELQDMLKGLDKSAEKAGTDSELSDALSTQVRRLAMEVRQLASARPVTVLNGNSGQAGNITSLIVPAATVGALGYGYMWWKGISFSDLMYVTKRNMANAVSSLTKHLEQVSDALAKTKRHLTQRIEGLDGKLDEQKEIAGQIKQEVTDVCGRVDNIGFNLGDLQRLVWGLDEKVNAIEDKQNFACAGVLYLVQYAEGKGGKMPDFLQDGLKGANRRGFNAGSLKGLQHITAAIETGSFDKSKTEAILQNEIDSLDNKKGLSRTPSIKC